MITIKKMTEKDIKAVASVEEKCFIIPWTRKDFEREILENEAAIYFVASDGDETVGFAGMWHVVNEGHITNVAVLPEYRGRSIGSRLMKALMEEADRLEMIGITLEVGMENDIAKKLYFGLGFKPEGIRKNYYDYTNEDAIIMWKYFDRAETSEGE